MTNPDTVIRRAVELADGWFITEGSSIEYVWCSPIIICGKMSDRHVKDALAAQLVRQVDATPHVTLDESQTRCFMRVNDNRVGEIIRGRDRSINRIRCIVEFAEQNPGVFDAD